MAHMVDEPLALHAGGLATSSVPRHDVSASSSLHARGSALRAAVPSMLATDRSCRFNARSGQRAGQVMLYAVNKAWQMR